jgi:hypothetical protein
LKARRYQYGDTVIEEWQKACSIEKEVSFGELSFGICEQCTESSIGRSVCGIDEDRELFVRSAALRKDMSKLSLKVDLETTTDSKTYPRITCCGVGTHNTS